MEPNWNYGSLEGGVAEKRRIVWQENNPRTNLDIGCFVQRGFKCSGESTEHMWVKVTSIEGNQVTGTLDNNPLHDVGFHFGDTITFDYSEIENMLSGNETKEKLKTLFPENTKFE